MNLRTALYRLASLLGDANAVKRNKVPQRIARKAAQRAAGGLLRKLLKW